MKWLRHSGMTITLIVNPAHWQWIPKVAKDTNQEYPDCMFLSYRAVWLFVRFNLWIDDGRW